MGFHCNLPQSLVFAPRVFGGIRKCNLKMEMEVQQIMILLHHMQAKMPLGHAIEILICQYHLWAGVLEPILQNTTPYSWVPDQWLSWIWQTMYAHNIQICYPAWVVTPLWSNDVFLMEVIQELNLTQQQLEQINVCHMYLQVTILAKIVDHTDMANLPQALSLHQVANLLDCSPSANPPWLGQTLTHQPQQVGNYAQKHYAISLLVPPSTPNWTTPWVSGCKATRIFKHGTGTSPYSVAFCITPPQQQEHVQPSSPIQDVHKWPSHSLFPLIKTSSDHQSLQSMNSRELLLYQYWGLHTSHCLHSYTVIIDQLLSNSKWP